jgi:hypothetical protein
MRYASQGRLPAVADGGRGVGKGKTGAICARATFIPKDRVDVLL